MKNSEQENLTAAGTNIDEVKLKNEQSGLSYNEVKEWLAKTTGGYVTQIYSDTDNEAVKEDIQQSKGK